MNGIDTAIASLITSRVDSLLNITPGGLSATQAGAANVETAPTPTPGTATPGAQASAQTALSAVALTLTAIMRSGGEATPAVLGQTPIWSAAPALELEADGLPLFDTFNADASSPANPNTTTTSADAASATSHVAATGVPVAQLAAALEQTVGESGLFYEAHLAQWLTGQRSPDSLANEPQNRLVAASTQLPLDWTGDGGEASASGNAARGGAAQNAPSNSGAADNAAAARAASSIPAIPNAQAARIVAGEVLASSVSDLNGQPAHAGLHSASTPAADAGSTSPSAQAMAAVHPATAPLVRQQLDLLATGQFRWIGEAWPGARFDWTIEQDGDEWDRSGGGASSEDDQPWRTRLTLSLPTLGTVDAELTLTGTRLMARVQASPGGASRLAMQGESFRQRLAAAGIELSGLSIREIGGGAPSTGAGAGSAGAAVAAAQAASAYARSASVAAADAAATASATAFTATAFTATATASTASTAPAGAHAPADDFDWDMS